MCVSVSVCLSLSKDLSPLNLASAIIIICALIDGRYKGAGTRSCQIKLLRYFASSFQRIVFKFNYGCFLLLFFKLR